MQNVSSHFCGALIGRKNFDRPIWTNWENIGNVTLIINGNLIPDKHRNIGTIDCPPKVQRNSGKANAIFWSSTTWLIAVTNFPCNLLCFPWGIGFWITCPWMYSLAGFVSGNLRNSSSVIVFSGTCTIRFFLDSRTTHRAEGTVTHQNNKPWTILTRLTRSHRQAVYPELLSVVPVKKGLTSRTQNPSEADKFCLFLIFGAKNSLIEFLRFVNSVWGEVGDYGSGQKGCVTFCEGIGVQHLSFYRSRMMACWHPPPRRTLSLWKIYW